MKQKIFLLLICIINLNAYQYTTKSIKEVIPIVEKDYIKCVNVDKIHIVKCKKIKETQLKELYLLDMDESRFEASQKLEKELEITSKLPPKKPTEAGQVMIANMNDCLDRAESSSDTKKCMQDMNSHKIFIKKDIKQIPNKNKIHIETEEEKPDLTTLLSYKDKLKQLKDANKAETIISSTKEVVNKNSSKSNNNATKVAKESVVDEAPIKTEVEVKKPKKKVRFKN